MNEKHTNYVIHHSDQLYSTLLSTHIAMLFPQRNPTDRSTTLEAIFTLLMGTKQTRNGPKPLPEVQVEIRNVIRHCLERGKPIPFMVPWGSRKPNGTGPDIAEMMCFKTLLTLQESVKAHYEPGLLFNIRVEDIAAHWVYWDEAQSILDAEVRTYRETIKDLTYILKVDDFIHIKPESDGITWPDFKAEAVRHYRLFGEYFRGSTQALATLISDGWGGPVASETVTFYMEQYKKLYADSDEAARLDRLAHYYAAVLTRNRNNLRGNLPEWGPDYLDLSFVQPIPGTDWEYSKRLYYKTIPTSTSRHLPPWRSKGYYTIDNQNNVIPHLTTFRELPDGLQPHTFTLTRDEYSILLHGDVLLVD